MKKYLLITLLFAAFIAGAVTLPRDTPVFADTDLAKAPIGSLPETLKLDSATPVRGFSARHPMAYYTDLYYVTLPGGSAGFAAPFVTITPGPDGTRVVIDAPAPLWRKALFVITGVLLAATLIAYCRESKSGRLAGKYRETWYFAAILLLLRQFLILYTTEKTNNLICSPSDEPGYLQVALDVLKNRWDGPWSYPVGHGLLFLAPTVLLTGAASYYELAIGFSYFSALVLAPLGIGIGFLIFRELGISARAAFFGCLLWVVWPFFFRYIPVWEAGLFTSFFDLPSDRMSFFNYTIMIAGGFNAMSDTPSTLLVLGTIYAALKLPPKSGSVAIVAAIFALACLTRLNNVFFAPAIGCALYFRHREALRSPGYLVRTLLIGSGVYLALIAIQLYVNYRQFGSPLTFSYVLHYAGNAPGERPADGFQWATVLKGSNLKFLAGSNFAIWTLGIAGLLLLKDRRQRMMLSLWAIPVILFFLGYSHTFCDGQRFILSSYLPLFAAFAALECWREADKPERIALTGFFALTLLFTVPYQIEIPDLTPFGLGKSSSGAAYLEFCFYASRIGAAWLLYYCWRLRQDRQAAYLVAIFAGLYFAAGAWVLAGLLAFILLRALFDLGVEVKKNPPWRLASPRRKQQ